MTDLPLPLPDGPYTLRTLVDYLNQLTAQSLSEHAPGEAKDFRRSVGTLHHLISRYTLITGLKLERVPGDSSLRVVMTEEQFRLFAAVVYRSTLDGTSYAYNIRRELGLPEEGYGLLVGEGPATSSAVQAPELSAEVLNLQTQVNDLREELAILSDVYTQFVVTLQAVAARAGMTEDELNALIDESE